MSETEDDEFGTIIYDEFLNTTSRGVQFRIADKEYWVSHSLVKEIDKEEKTIIVDKWYYDQHFL